MIRNTSQTPAIMLQGTGSDVGKSLLVAGLCRFFADRGLAVRPFKPQNMSNNAAVTADGGEIGRAQALQARAARAAPSVHMNPVLLKPQSDTGAQVVVQGRVAGRREAGTFHAEKPALLPAVLESFAKLSAEADLVVVEGAGSAAEVNLRAGDIANMGFARAVGVPVLLIGDIDRGGVIASLVGTHRLLDRADRDLVAGFIVNRFRGDPRLFDDGYARIENETGWAGLGVVPWFHDARLLPAEDAIGDPLRPAERAAAVKIAVPVLAHIANFDDTDPLAAEPGVTLDFVYAGRPLPADADLILLPGSKATLADLAFLREQGWDIDIRAHVRQGKPVLGLCGGYQMLGRTVSDPAGIEGLPGSVPGLGLLDVDTVLQGDKRLVPAAGRHRPSGQAVRGYEMHIGRTEGADCRRSLLTLSDGTEDGAIGADGLVAGCYLHGLFAADGFRAAFLTGLRTGAASASRYEATVEAVLDRLAAHLATHLDVEAILDIARRSTQAAA